MSLLIKRAMGDTTPVKIRWTGDVDLSSVTAIEMRLYDSSSKTTLLDRLIGEVRGFDPFTYFPVPTSDWTGTRYLQIVLMIGDETKPMADLGKWINT